MKRIFPLIIGLITLSLVGIILLQVSWFQQMTKLRYQQLLESTEKAAFEVAIDLGRNASFAPFMKIPRKSTLSLLPDDYGISLKRPTISQHYSSFEIIEKLTK